MAIAARISSSEVSSLIGDRFSNTYCEARLINAPGTEYTPGVTNDATFLGNEVTLGTGGYERQVVNYVPGDVGAYTDGGVGLTQKVTVFAHDNSGDVVDFTHVALVWSTGNTTSLGAVTAAPASATNGTYTNIPIDSTNGSGTGLTVDLTVSSSGATTGDYALTLNKPGRGYSASDTLTISNGTLAGLMGVGAGDLVFSVGGVATNSNGGDIVSVAKTAAAVSLTAGNEAAFYWNVKLFGFYSA